jgi:hypothetical protein
MRGLADCMTHSSEVQKAFYVRQKRLKTGAALQRIIMEGVVAVESRAEAGKEEKDAESE